MITWSNGNIFRVTGHLSHKGQWRRALIISLICGCITINNREAGDWRRHRTHYDVTVMKSYDGASDTIILRWPWGARNYKEINGCQLNCMTMHVYVYTLRELNLIIQADFSYRWKELKLKRWLGDDICVIHKMQRAFHDDSKAIDLIAFDNSKHTIKYISVQSVLHNTGTSLWLLLT